MFDEHGFGDHGTGAAGTGQSGDRCQQVQKKNGQIANRTILPTSRHQELLRHLAIRHAHAGEQQRHARDTVQVAGMDEKPRSDRRKHVGRVGFKRHEYRQCPERQLRETCFRRSTFS